MKSNRIIILRSTFKSPFLSSRIKKKKKKKKNSKNKGMLTWQLNGIAR